MHEYLIFWQTWRAGTNAFGHTRRWRWTQGYRASSSSSCLIWCMKRPRRPARVHFADSHACVCVSMTTVEGCVTWGAPPRTKRHLCGLTSCGYSFIIHLWFSSSSSTAAEMFYIHASGLFTQLLRSQIILFYSWAGFSKFNSPLLSCLCGAN